MAYQHIDLKPYMGDEGMFPEIGEIKDIPNFEKVTDEKGVRFLFERNDNNEFGVFCDRQELRCLSNCRQIYIAGFAFWGTHNGKFILNFEDGREIVNIKFSDWFHPEDASTDFENEQISYAETLFEIPINDSKLHIYHKSICVEGTRKLQSIILPENPFLVVFAVTAEE